MTQPAHLQELQMSIDAAVIRQYALLTQDANPIHLDPDFARRTPMGGIIAHGTLSLSLIWQSIAVSLGSTALVGSELEVSFVQPVREGDLITAGGELAEVGLYRVWARRRTGAERRPVVLGQFRLTHSSGN